eukprot:359116-Chlamydomonas_euryale.AAC.16
MPSATANVTTTTTATAWRPQPWSRLPTACRCSVLRSRANASCFWATSKTACRPTCLSCSTCAWRCECGVADV